MKNVNHVAIAGAGLVGSLLSIFLARRGYKVSVFERRGDMRQGNADAGRSINLALSARGIRALDLVGMADTVRKAAIPMKGRMTHDLKGNLNFLPYGKEGEHINSISRSALNIVLMDAAAEQGVTFFFNSRCIHVDLETTSLTIQDTLTGHTGIRNFDLIAGADGAFSAVRSAMQITDRFNYSQHYIEHGYKELQIPAGTDGSFLLEKNALHIWPRESYMMIALPNPDGSFTCTLFFPFEGTPSFRSLDSNAKVQSFFSETFPDAVPFMPDLLQDYNANPTSSLVTIKCFPWTKNKTFMIGDAAHGIVPFYGQGMNAGFEDCRILNESLESASDNWEVALDRFQTTRKADTDAIAQLALDNFVEMRDLVADPEFLLRKKIEAKLHALYPDRWIPLYSMVTFNENIPYSQAYEKGQKQLKIMKDVMSRPGIERTWEQLDFKQIADRLD